MRKRYTENNIAILLFFGILILAIVGWVANIVKLIGMDIDPITTLFVVRIVGIFVAPVGAVLGYF